MQPLPESPEHAARIWAQFREHPACLMLLNDVDARIAGLRLELETCGEDRLKPLQESLKTAKAFRKTLVSHQVPEKWKDKTCQTS